MKTTSQRLIGNGQMAYDTLFTNNGSFEWFKSSEDAYIYVLNTETNRATRYNAEGQNPHRYSVSLYNVHKAEMEARREAKAAELDKAAEDENVSIEEFAQQVEEINYCRHPHGEDLNKPAELNEFGCVDCSKCNVQECVHRNCMRRNPTNVGGLGECPRLKVEANDDLDVDDWNDARDSHNAWTAVDEITYDVVAHAIRSLGKTDAETEEIMGKIGKDTEMVMDFNEATSNLNADEFNSYIKARLDVILNGGANGNTTGSLTEATEAHREVETAENTTDGQNATESLGEATENAPKKKVTKKTAKKARKSKDIAFKTTITLADDRIADVTLTAKQVDFVKHLPDTNFWEQGLGSCVWVDILCDEIGGQFTDKPMTVGAMISTLCEKGLGVRGKDRVNGRKCTSFALTELGKKVAKELGLH